MKSAGLFMSALLAGGTLAFPVATFVDEPIPATPPANTQQPDRLAAALQAIRQAPEPSAAVQAYADA